MELKPDECQVTLLEYDRRFEIYGDDFVFYDYNKPLELPEALQKESFDMVIADPPFLSEECLRKTAQTIKLLAKGKILLCTGTNNRQCGWGHFKKEINIIMFLNPELIEHSCRKRDRK